MKVAFDTLGCKLNQAETESLARQLVAAGHRLVSSVDEADIYLLNTCTVTHIADAKSRHLLRLAHRRNADARLVVVGCYVQRAPQELAGMERVNLVVGNEDKYRLPQLLEESGCLTSSPSVQGRATTGGSVLRTRSLVKIQDGCNYSCSYCIVPLVRGRGKSLSADRIIAEVKQDVAEGGKEVVLTGTEIGTYDDSGINLTGLLKRILVQTGVARLRLSSLQPQEISAELTGLWRDERLCSHFHLSLQSGSDAVLKRMKRLYSTADYRQAVSLIRATVPDVAVTTDVIAGFPGETSEEFEESLEFCCQIGFARIHVFPYSPRPGTAAAEMPVQVKDKVKKQRSQELLALAEESSRAFRQKFAGRVMPVLWEQESDGVWSGHTGNYVKVYTRNDGNLSNRLLPMKLTRLWGDGMWGEVAGEGKNRI